MKRSDSGLIATSFRTLPELSVYRPRGLAEATHILAESDVPPVLLAGGTDLVAQLNDGLTPPAILDLRGIAELRTIARRGRELHLGALATHADGPRAPALQVCPGFAAAWSRIASVRVRFTATLGGNLMARRPSYEMPVLLAAAGGRLAFAAAKTPHVVDATDFAQHPPVPRAILTHAVVPLAGLVAFDYDRSLRPALTLALCVRRSAGALQGRAVIGTENLPPVVLDFALGADAVTTAREAFRHVPSDLDDPVTSNAYLRAAGTTLLARLLAKTARGTN